ncbi:RNA-directed DNA polymerase from transposon X-element [Apiospora aurea]|uniref:RNA-directed DNA polymerase from transposon X-element n=1 Tax=Apiospora aurea TaxID=335848 RepID=A0ABR1QVB1_9PEZI
MTAPEEADPNRGYVATLHLKTPGGDIHVTNVYNHEQHLDIDRLMRFLSGDGYDIVVGDVNLQHQHWEGDHGPSAPTPRARRLQENMEAASMKLLTPRGTTAFRKTASPGGIESTIHLAFAAEEILKMQPVHQAMEVFRQDHLLMDIQLEMDVSRISRTLYKTKDMDKVACRQGMKGCLRNGFGPHELLGTSHPLNTPGDVDDYTNRITECLTVPFYAIVEKIEISPTRSVRFVTNNVKRYEQRELKAQAEYKRKGDLRSFEQWQVAASTRAFVVAKHEKEMWRRRQSTIGRRTSGIYRMVKGVSRRLRPKVYPPIGPLKVDQSEKLVYEPPEIVDCLLSSQFGKENISQAPPAVNASTSEHDPADISTDDEVPIVDPYQIKFILAKLRTGAAMGPDGVPNFVLKLCRGQGSEACGDPFREMIIEPYLAHLFQASLLKPGKERRSPRARRPVALLPCLGKVYEELVADTLKHTAIRSLLIPYYQLVFAGKSTVTVVVAITNERRQHVEAHPVAEVVIVASEALD